jgi:hypothetical protein
MVAPTAGSVVLVPFPFSDLSVSKRRPAVVLADAERGGWDSASRGAQKVDRWSGFDHPAPRVNRTLSCKPPR